MVSSSAVFVCRSSLCHGNVRQAEAAGSQSLEITLVFFSANVQEHF